MSDVVSEDTALFLQGRQSGKTCSVTKAFNDYRAKLIAELGDPAPVKQEFMRLKDILPPALPDST